MQDLATIAVRAYPRGQRRPRDLLPLWAATRIAARRLYRLLERAPDSREKRQLLRATVRLLRQLEGYRVALLDANPDDEVGIEYTVIQGLLTPSQGAGLEVGAIPWPVLASLGSIIGAAAEVVGLTQNQAAGLTSELTAKLRERLGAELQRVLPKIPSTEEIWARVRPYMIVSTLGILSWVLYRMARGPAVVVKC